VNFLICVFALLATLVPNVIPLAALAFPTAIQAMFALAMVHVLKQTLVYAVLTTLEVHVQHLTALM